MIPFALYPAIFTDELLWYGDEVKAYVEESTTVAQLEALAKLRINSLILKKVLVNKQLVGMNGKNILKYPYMNKGFLYLDKEVWSKNEVKDIRNEPNFTDVALFYHLIEGIKSYWVVDWFDYWELSESISNILHVFNDEAERLHISEDEYWEELAFMDFDSPILSRLAESQENSQENSFHEWCREKGFDKKAEENIEDAIDALESVVTECPCSCRADWISTVYDNAFLVAIDQWNNVSSFDTAMYTIPVLDDWIDFKNNNKIDNGELEQRADYLFQFIIKENGRMWKTYFSYAEPDYCRKYGYEYVSVHFNIYMMEVDEVIDLLNAKYHFSQKEKTDINCRKSVKEVKQDE